MPNSETPRYDFPIQFWKLAIGSLRFYKRFFLNYFMLALLSYLPFIIFNRLVQTDFTEFTVFLHGGFLDIIIFLTVPCVFAKNKALPLAAISLFLQNFFASAVLINLIQSITLVFFIKLLSGFGLLSVILGPIPYIFITFAGFFLIMENSPRLISVKNNLLNSVKLVKKFFLPVLLNYTIITILTLAPLSMFSVWYFSLQPELIAFLETINPVADNSPTTGEELIKIIQIIIEKDEFQWGRAFIHITFRPIKSIFLSLLFLGLLNYISPQYIKKFLGEDIGAQK